MRFTQFNQARLIAVMVFLMVLVGVFFWLSGNDDSKNVKLSNKVQGSTSILEEMNFVKLPYSDYVGIAEAANKVYISVSEGKGNLTDKIIKYDLNTKKEEDIYVLDSTSKKVINSIQCNQDYLMWVESYENGAYPEIKIYDVKSKQTKTVYGNQSDYLYTGAVLYKDNVVFLLQNNEVIGDIVKINIVSKVKKVIGKIKEPGAYNSRLVLKDDKLLWTDSIDGIGKYFVYDFVTEESVQTDAPYPYPGYSQMIGNQFASIFYYDKNNLWTQRFGLYKPATKKYIRLLSGKVDSIDASDKNLAIIDEKQKLYVYQMATEQIEEHTEKIDGEVRSILFTEDGQLIVVSRTKDDRVGITLMEIRN